MSDTTPDFSAIGRALVELTKRSSYVQVCRDAVGGTHLVTVATESNLNSREETLLAAMLASVARWHDEQAGAEQCYFCGAPRPLVLRP